MKEIWKPISGYEGLYDVSNLGRVRSLPRNGTVSGGQIRKNMVDRFGYNIINLYNNGCKCYRVHRLVASAFLDNPDHKEQVNHIDGNKSNNIVNNLEWATPSENLKHKFRVLGYRPSDNGLKKPILCVETNRTFRSIREAARTIGVDRCTINGALTHRHGQKTAGGFHWEYV